MNIFLVNQDHPDSKGLMVKLSEQGKDGAIIPLTNGEMDLYHSPNFSHLTPDNTQKKIVQLNTDPHNSYIFIMDERTDNIDDAIHAIDYLNLKARIIRVRGES